MNERNRGNATMTAAATANDQLSSSSSLESPACDNGGADGWLGGCVPIMLRPPALAQLMHIEDAGNTNCRFVYPSPHFHFPPVLYEQRDGALPHCTVRVGKAMGERQNSEATMFNACLNSSWNRLWSDTVRSRARFGKQMRTFLEHIHKIPLCSPSLSASAFSATSISLSPSSLPRAQWTALYSTRPLIGRLPSFLPSVHIIRARGGGGRGSPSFRAHFRDSR